MEDNRVKSVPEGLPMAFKYESLVYYVRDCYATYYAQIKELLGNPGKDYISVTGTPGIGKSIFYLYVFSKYREEYPDKTIVTAAFTKNQVLKSCVVFYPDGTRKLCMNDFRGDYIPVNEEGSIHFYDGPPNKEPSRSQMVTFTSPNESWLGSIHKAANHCKLYMPVWTFKELCDANDLLGLGIEDQTLRKDYGIFGGVARYCLATSETNIEDGYEKLDSALGRICSFDDVETVLRGGKDLQDYSHCLFHYLPKKFKDTEYCFFARSIFGSKWIATKIEERIRVKKKVERVDLMRWLYGVDKGSALYGWLFEQYAHETFQQGGHFQVLSLMDGKERDLILKPEIGHYDKFTTIALLEKVFHDIYMIPSTNNFESLDSFYYSESEKTMYAFQITTSAVHDVKAYGLMKLLELNGLKEEILKRKIELLLVFVIPQGLGHQFGRQHIIFDDIPMIEDLSEYPVQCVRGIGGAKRCKRLREQVGINTGKELYDAVKRNAPEISFVRNIGVEFVEKVDARGSWNFLSSIPQLYIELALKRE